MAKRIVTLDGISASIRAHAKRIGISYGTVMLRISKGMSPTKALTTPPRPAAIVRQGEEVLTVADVMARTGLSRSAAYERIALGNPTKPKREPRRVELDGEMLTIREFAEREGVSRQAVYERIAKNEPPPRADEPQKPRGPKPRLVVLDGIEATIAEHMKRTGACRPTVTKWARTTGTSGTPLGPRTKGPRT
jgi:predicted DNA-binding transcriptional regulator AlpA